MLQAEKLTKVYRNGVAGLVSLDLAVARGEIVCLLGANGAGKTTAINLFLDFVRPTSGSCSINGFVVSRSPLEAKRHVAYLAENVMLYGNFTAYQNIDFFAKVAGHSVLGKAQYDEVFSLVGLPQEARDRRVRTFSKGMRQKVGIAIAVVKNTDSLILDEPMSGLDPKAAAELVEALLVLRERGKAILISTHDLFRAKILADRIVILNRGHKLIECSCEELQNANLEQIYLASIETDERKPSLHVSADLRSR